MPHKTLLIGIDAADWLIAKPWLEAGKLPNLKNLMENGCHGPLKSMMPSVSPMLWTSIATGKHPYKHNIIGFVEENEGKLQPVSSYRRKEKAIWDVLGENGKRSLLVNWWPSHPALPLEGVCVSNQFFQPKENQSWLDCPEAVYPPERYEEMAKLRIHPSLISDHDLRHFVPLYPQIPADKRANLETIILSIAETATVANNMTSLMKSEDWDFGAVYFDILDKLQHAFVRYLPPKPHFVDEREFIWYSQVVRAAYQWIDAIIGEIVSTAGEDAQVMVVSDHGFKSGEERLDEFPDEPGGPTFEHRDEGVFIFKGKGTTPGCLIHDACLLDIAPTLLASMDLPLADDLDGKFLDKCFSKDKNPKKVATYGEFTAQSRGMGSSSQILQRLAGMGYISLTDNALQVVADNQYYLAQAYFFGKQTEKAIQLLESLCSAEPEIPRYGVKLFQYYLRAGEMEKAGELLPKLQISEAEKEWLLSEWHTATNDFGKALADLNKLPKTNQVLYRKSQMLIASNRLEEAESLLLDLVSRNPNQLNLTHSLGVLFLLKMDGKKALPLLERVAMSDFSKAKTHFHLAQAYRLVGRNEDANQALQVAISIDPAMGKAYEQAGQDDSGRLYEGELIVVSGLPRSGTSMMMQWLEKLGVPIYSDYHRKADEHNPYGYFESEAAKRLQYDHSWLPDAAGKAVKVVAPLLPFLPSRMRYKVIFMRRNKQDVLRSQQKMLSLPYDTLPLQLLAELEQAEKEALDWMEKQTNVDFWIVDYEAAVQDEQMWKELLKKWLGMV